MRRAPQAPRPAPVQPALRSQRWGSGAALAFSMAIVFKVRAHNHANCLPSPRTRAHRGPTLGSAAGPPYGRYLAHCMQGCREWGGHATRGDPTAARWQATSKATSIGLQDPRWCHASDVCRTLPGRPGPPGQLLKAVAREPGPTETPMQALARRTALPAEHWGTGGTGWGILLGPATPRRVVVVQQGQACQATSGMGPSKKCCRTEKKGLGPERPCSLRTDALGCN